MTSTASPRASLAAREAIRRHLAARNRSEAIPVSKMLSDLRTERPPLRESDEELVYLIVEDAIDHGLAVHFDHGDER